MISRSRCTRGSADGRPGLRRIRKRGRRHLIGGAAPPRGRARRRRCRRCDGTARATSRRLDHQQRQSEHAAPGFPFGDQVVAVGAMNSGTDRPPSRCSSMTAVAAGSSPSAGNIRMLTPRNSATGTPTIHADAAHRAPQHDAVAIAVRPAGFVRLRRRRAPHSGRAGRRGRAATRGSTQRGPNTHLTPQTLPAELLCPVVPRSCRRASIA